MADDNGHSDGDGLDSMLPKVSEDQPLNSLVPEMNEGGGAPAGAGDGAPSRPEPIHPRVLEVGLEEGTEWNIACWQDPGPMDFDDQLRRLLRATLLRELSRPAERLRERDKQFIGMRLMDFDGLAPDSRGVLGELGFDEERFRPDAYAERMDAWRAEARQAGLQLGHSPESMWHLDVKRKGGETGAAIETVAERMDEAIDDQVWGETPGAMSRHLARLFDEELELEIELGLEGLRTLQETVFADESGVIRWTHPLIFQGVCDFLGVVLHGKYGIRVQWGVCEPDPNGIVPPPMFRLSRDGHDQTIPVGTRVLEWCVLPLAPDDERSELDERVEQLARLIG